MQSKLSIPRARAASQATRAAGGPAATVAPAAAVATSGRILARPSAEAPKVGLSASAISAASAPAAATGGKVLSRPAAEGSKTKASHTANATSAAAAPTAAASGGVLARPAAEGPKAKAKAPGAKGANAWAGEQPADQGKRRMRLFRKTPDWLWEAGVTPAKKKAKALGPLHDEGVKSFLELVCDVEMLGRYCEAFGCGKDLLPEVQDRGERALMDLLADPEDLHRVELTRERLRDGLSWLTAIEHELKKPMPSAATLAKFSCSYFAAAPLGGGAPVSGVAVDAPAPLAEQCLALEALLDIETVYIKLARLAAGRGYRKMGSAAEGEKGAGSAAAMQDKKTPEVLQAEAEVQSLEEQLGARRRPSSAYFQWFAEHRASIAQDLGPGSNICAVAKKSGEVWRGLSGELRAPYESRYKQAREEYDHEQQLLREKRTAAAEAVDPLVQRQYRMLGCDLETLAIDSKAYAVIEKYARSTAADQQVKVARILSVTKHGEEKTEAKFAGRDGRTLLWYGAPLSSWASVLSQGFRLPPAETPFAGRPFGKGLYFLDSSCAALERCRPVVEDGEPRTRQVLLLAEVALGRVFEQAQPGDHKVPYGYGALLGRGAVGPDPKNAQNLPGGVKVPMGPLQAPPQATSGAFPYNEYAVFGLAQVRMRYLVELLVG